MRITLNRSAISLSTKARLHYVRQRAASIRSRPLPPTYSAIVSATPKLSTVWRVSVGARKLSMKST